MIFTSPYPDIEIPSVALTDFVLEHSAEYGDKPALIDGATGAAYTHAQAARAIRAAAGGLAARGIAKGDVVALYAANAPDYVIAFHAVAALGAVVHDDQPDLHRRRARLPARARRGARAASAGPERHRPRARGGGPRRRRGALRLRRGGRGDAVRRAARRRSRRGARHARRARRPRRAALLERDHGPAQGRDAHPPQPGGQHPAVDRPAARDRRRHARRRPAALPHLRPDRGHERGPAQRRDARHDAALRPRGLPGPRRRSTAPRRPTSSRRSSSPWPRARSSSASTSRA